MRRDEICCGVQSVVSRGTSRIPGAGQGQEAHSARDLSKNVTGQSCESPSFARFASRREQLFALRMLCTGTKRVPFFWGLDWVARPCSRRFYVRTADVRKHICHSEP